MSRIESGSRASTQPHVTLEEAATLHNHWVNIAHDFDLLHELYDERDPRVVLSFGRAKLPSLDQMQKYVDEVRRLFETIKKGTTNQRGQSQIRFTYERMRRLRNDVRVAIQRSREILQTQFPENEAAAPQPESRGIGMRASRPDSPQMRGLSYEMRPEPQPESPSLAPRPLQSSKRPRQSSSTSPDIPPIARRLNPGYSAPISLALPSLPNSSQRSQRPPYLNPQTPSSDHEEIFRLREENRDLRADNIRLREQHQEEKDGLNDWFKLQEQEIDQKDKEIEQLKKENEALKKGKAE
jgi:hypothetical protein